MNRGSVRGDFRTLLTDHHQIHVNPFFVAEPVKGFERGVSNEMLDAFRYNRFAEVVFSEKSQSFPNNTDLDLPLVVRSNCNIRIITLLYAMMRSSVRSLNVSMFGRRSGITLVELLVVRVQSIVHVRYVAAFAALPNHRDSPPPVTTGG